MRAVPADSVLGCIVGGAIGDAAGAAFEGMQTASVPLLSAAQDWRLTDDTQLTLATCEAITEAGGPEPASIAASLLRWFRARRLTGLGASTLKALRDLDAGAHWALAGRKGDRAAGNGAAMRAAPLAFCADPETEEGRRLIRDVCRITHHSDEAYAGALAVVLAIRAATASVPQDSGSSVERVILALPDTSVRDRLAAYANLPAGTPLAEAASRFGASGYVADSVPLAIYAAGLVGKLGFTEMLGQVIAAGGDTDTNASLAGQIAGAAVGVMGLPAEFLDLLPQAETVLAVANEFAAFVKKIGPRSISR